MRICHVCNGHTVDDGRVFHRACCELAKAGYEVHLLAQGSGETAYKEAGVIIHPLPKSEGRWQRYARVAQIAKAAADLKADLYHVHEPDLLGPVIKRVGSRPVIYDVHEIYLDLLRSSTWIPRLVRPLVVRAWDMWEQRLVQRCAAVIVVTEPQSQRYVRLHNDVRIVANYPDLSCNEGLPAVERDGMTCVFTGVLRPDRGISNMFEALASLKRRGLLVRLVLAGNPISGQYLTSLLDEAKALDIGKQVRYCGVLSKRDALLLQHQASIGLIADLPYNYFTAALPTKLVECMSMGVPVVCSDLPIYRQVGGDTGAAIMIDPTKPEQIADAIESLVRDPARAYRMGEAGKAAVRDRFNWQVESTKLLDLYRQLIGAPQSIVTFN